MPVSNMKVGNIKEGQIIGVLGVKGGVGSSTFALNLASALALAEKVNLVDGNLQQPDLATLLNVSPRFNLQDLSPRLDGLTEEMLASMSLPEKDLGNLTLITPPLVLDQALTISPYALVNLLAGLRQLNHTTVIDLPKIMDQTLLDLLDSLSHLFLLIEATVPAIAAAARWLKVISDLGFAGENLTIVLNRAGGKNKEIEGQILQMVKDRDFNLVKLANDFKEVENAAVVGLPLVLTAPRCAYSRSLKNIVASISLEYSRS